MEIRAKKNRYKPDRKQRKERIGHAYRGIVRYISGIIGFAVLSVFLVFVHDLVTQTDYFKAKAILVEGNHQLSEEAVLQQGQVEAGNSILAVNLSLTRRRLLAHPWIREATVNRQLPDRIQIRIQEEKPMAVVDLGKPFLINLEGEIFKEWAPSDPVDLPLIRGLDFTDVRIPDAPPSAAWDAALSVLKLARTPDAVFPIHGIKVLHADPETGITLCLFGGDKTVHLGYRDFSEKIREVRQAIFELNATNTLTDFDAIDVKEADRIVVSPIRTEKRSGSDREA